MPRFAASSTSNTRWRASLIEANRDKIEAMTKALLEWETIDADQINDIMAGKPPRPPKPRCPSGHSATAAGSGTAGPCNSNATQPAQGT